MRIFTAFPIQEDARRELYAGYAPVREALDSVRWVSEENLHITLIFFGEMTPAELDGLLAALEPGYPGEDRGETNLAGPPRFKVEYRGIECFPPRGKPKVIYSRLVSGGAECIEVWSRMSGRLGAEGIKGSFKPYVPHITLGRIKARGYYPRPGAYEEISGEFAVSSFGVFESKLTPEGPEYRLVRSFSLGEKTV